ncbi:hypothetical protein ACFPT7_08685 [Acidicapsa dinghuensis]|uniref:Uncharacterized protein n=1 Tax=Acidicapsa dinghuensis TaxID=2218256 RepID=A0ABW1EDG5_9BACT|nr:hypothetical protein [Acidicapsa dinghuensis]
MPLLIFAACSAIPSVYAQSEAPEPLEQKVQKLTEALARTQAQLEQSQQALAEMRRQLIELQHQMAQSKTDAVSESADPASSSSDAHDLSAAVEEIRERQAMDETQIATQEQVKVESASRYPVKITGLLLLNSFVNTGAVDMPATPTVAIPGSGSTGASIRQSILGLDARGPHLFGASSYADLRVDFNGSSSSTGPYTGYYNSNSAILRLRTAHAGLRWNHTEAYFSLDHPIFTPDTPTSLTAVAIPALAWSGNLWTWNPQVGINQDVEALHGRTIRLQAVLVDVGDAPLTTEQVGTTTSPPSSAEQSRWPGVETHIALLGDHASNDQPHNHFGIGGYFASHSSTLVNHGFDSWAATLDAGLLLPARLQFTGSFYRGLALGGLGGGAYKDFALKPNDDSTGYYFRPLDDVGGWAQLKEKLAERLELNAAFGIDDVFANELRRYNISGNTLYQNLDRTRTYTGNVIYSPSAYLLFSLEYRHFQSTLVTGSSSTSNIIGVGAGYKF